MKPEADGERYARQIRSSAGASVFSGDRSDPKHRTTVGRACQRFGLKATAMGLKQAFINQPVEVPGQRAELASRAGLAGRQPDFVMRFGVSPELPRSLRRPVEEVVVPSTLRIGTVWAGPAFGVADRQNRTLRYIETSTTAMRGNKRSAAASHCTNRFIGA